MVNVNAGIRTVRPSVQTANRRDPRAAQENEMTDDAHSSDLNVPAVSRVRTTF